MWLSDTSVRRPVFATVISLLLVAFGLLAFERLPLREYPDIDPPIISIRTDYIGASAAVVESKITQLIEDAIAGVEGIRFISSSSQDGLSLINVEFSISRDIDNAANDIRDRVSRVLSRLPDEADPPQVQKTDSDEAVIMWLNLVSEHMSTLELTDYAERFVVDHLSTLDGVARVQLSGGLQYSMRIWLDRQALAARQLTVLDVEEALHRENVELPAGTVKSLEKDFTVRIDRGYQTPEDFGNLVIRGSPDGYLVRLQDVARVEVGPVERRRLFRGNTVSMVGMGIVKQSSANTLDVTRAAKAERDRLNQTLPPGIQIMQSFDSSVFIEGAIREVYNTLAIAAILVVLVILLFLGNFRAMLVPAVTVPVSLVATAIVLYALDYSINLLTLLALVLAIGLVVDDGIVVLENIHRRMTEGESPLVAAFNGARQVGFAVVATTLVLIAVFVPITFMQGNVGRLFAEFAIALTAAVIFSSLVALTLCPVMCSKLLKRDAMDRGLSRFIENLLARMQRAYGGLLRQTLQRPLWPVLLLLATLGMSAYLFQKVPAEFAPGEDRGVFFMVIRGPEGTSFDFTTRQVFEIEQRLMPLVETGEIKRLLLRAPAAFGSAENYNEANAVVVLEDWGQRRSAWEIMADVRARLGDVTGVQVFPIMPQALGGISAKPVRFVIGGGSYEELSAWRDIVMEKASELPGLFALDHDFRETKPQLRVNIHRDRAGDLGVSVLDISRTLETLLGSRRVTTFMLNGEEYDVILESEPDQQRTIDDMQNIYVRSTTTGLPIPLSNLVSVREVADASRLNRYNRMRAITIEANLQDGYSLGEALADLERIVREHLPPNVAIDYKGESLEYRESGQAAYFIFALALLVVYLVMAAQFESFVHPLVIMLTVPLAIAGALLGLFLTGQTLNIYSQIGLIMLVGLATKNGILMVEFANQLRDEGFGFEAAIVRASELRLRPIVMTAFTSIVGAVPLILAFGAGSEARIVIGVVVIFGVALATLFTLLVVPVAYYWLCQRTSSPDATGRRLESELRQVMEEPSGP